ncbi:hypothetical protein [Aliagarivorans taiwanensis]|uniref:hypothetical protein n=1 Tax=Aliagarivorans taiwanensis TaxID=561966 RepID=UPI000478DAE9|nr:hypothetical protein [Aliagarivorans taiwanensis]
MTVRYVLLGTICLLVGRLAHAAITVEVSGGNRWAHDSGYAHQEPTSAIWQIALSKQISNQLLMGLAYQSGGTLRARHYSLDERSYQFFFQPLFSPQNKWQPLARLGFSYWDVDKHEPKHTLIHRRGFSPLMELGARYQLSHSLSVGLRFQYIYSVGDSKTGEYDSQALLLGLGYQWK